MSIFTSLFLYKNNKTQHLFLLTNHTNRHIIKADLWNFVDFGRSIGDKHGNAMKDMNIVFFQLIYLVGDMLFLG